MGKKYIIELEDNESVYKTVVANGYPMIQIIVPAPYTEPDMEQVRKEAYDKGYDDAKSGYDNGFENGMIVAWEAARKVTQVRKYGGYGDCLEEVFGHHRVPWDVFDYSAFEAIEKIRQYEQEREMDGLRQNIQTIVDQCGYTLDEIAEVLQKMKES